MKLLPSIFGIYLLLFSFLVVPEITSAQLGEDVIGKNLYLETLNPYPKPNSVVEVKLNDYSYARTINSITWLVNGEVMAAAANGRTVFVSVGEAGTVTNVSAVVENDNGSKDTVNLQLHPFYVDLIIEPQTRVPSFYKGRSIPSIGSQVTASVILNGLTAGVENFTYIWEVNDRALDGGAVRGKNKAVFTTPNGQEFTLSISVTDLDGIQVARRIINVLSVNPEVHFYESTALYGLGQRSLSNLILSGETATVRAEPYYLDSNTFNRPEHLVWKINSTNTQNPSSNPYEITLSRFSNPTQGAAVGFEVRSLSNLLQGAKKSLTVSF